MKKGLKIVVAIPIGLYVLYVAAIAAILNTPIFGLITEMTDPGKTHLRFESAYSFVPGKIRIGKIRVLVREPDVDLDVLLERAQVSLDFGALAKKRVRITSLLVDETTVAIRTKAATDEGIVASDPLEAPSALARERDRLENRWTIEVERVDLANLLWVKIDEDELRGRMAIAGAFLLQPGAQAEVFPSRFVITDGNWNGDVTNIRLSSEVRIHRFKKARVSGSEVFRYLDARIEATAKTSGLQLLNITLRSLGDYGFGNGEANLAGNVEVRSGKIMGGSAVRAEKSTIRMSAPNFEINGKGRIEWKTDASGEYSTLHARVSDAKADLRIGRNRIQGSVREVIADAKILGLDLPTPFTGLSARLRLRGGRLLSAPLPRSGTNKFRYSVKARLGGELTAVAGEYPDDSFVSKPSRFTVEIDESALAIPKLGTIYGDGRIAFTVRPIDFRDGRVEFPRVRIAYRGELDRKYPFALEWVSTRATRVFATRKKNEERWEGDGRMKIEDFNGVLNYLSDSDRISGIARAGLHATEVLGSFDWAISPLETRVKIRHIDSNGSWSGSGTLVSERNAADSSSETHGRFDGKVLGFPIGVGIAEGDVEVNLSPGEENQSEAKGH